jgi:hypothetical protein
MWFRLMNGAQAESVSLSAADNAEFAVHVSGTLGHNVRDRHSVYFVLMAMTKTRES